MRNIFLLVILSSLPFLSSCDQMGFHSWTWHQNLTVTVDTPYGVKTGSAVTKASFRTSPKWWGVGDARGSSTSSFRGEAVAVDLGNGRYLFAVIDKYGYGTARDAFIPKSERPRNSEQVVQAFDRLVKQRDERILPAELYPTLVAFRDMKDPTSITRVNPRDLSSVFGNGFRLRSITLSLTEAPVTSDRIQNILPWLEQVGRSRTSVKGLPQNGLIHEQSDPEIYRVTPLSFSTELFR